MEIKGRKMEEDEIIFSRSEQIILLEGFMMK
jgi:hypothetical protein